MSSTVGRFRLLREVARGGMGAVWQAQAPDGQVVALKLLLAGRQATKRQRRRFETEARALLTVRHPGVVALLDAGEHEGVPYLALEWVEGESLEQRLTRAGPLEPLAAARLIRDVALSLAHCHARGVLHRDLKPGNVLVRAADEAGLLTDFGLARGLLDTQTLAESDARTLTGAGLGTPGFWAPEQAHGQLDRVGPRADVYGLGATLYAALTGQPPHHGTDLGTLIRALERLPERPGRLAPATPPALEAVCLRCLEPEPQRRYPSAAALAEDLTAVLEGRAPSAVTPLRRGSGTALLAGATLLALGGLALAARTALAPPPAAAPTTQRDPAPVESPTATAPAEAPPDPGARVRALILASSQPAPGPVDAGRRRGAEDAIAGGLAFAAEGDHTAALREFDRAVELDPASPVGWYDRGLSRLASGDPEGALGDFTRTVILSPENPRGWQNRAGARERLGDLAGAADDLTRVLEVAPDWPGARRDRGTLRARAGDPRGGLEDLDRAIAETPEDPEAWFARGLVREDLDDHQGAVEDSTRALELDCQRPAYAYICRGNARAGLGLWVAAIDDLLLARARRPDEREIGFNLALVMARAGEHTAAVQVCDELLARAPEDAGLLALRARAHLGAGDPARALEDAGGALRARPGHLLGHLRRGLARHALGLPGAREDLEAYLAQASPGEEGRPEAEAALARLR